MQRIRSLLDLAGRYDAVLCDVWGVIHDGHHVYPGAAELLAELRAGGTIVVLVTNTPRPASGLDGELQRVGLPRSAWDVAVTSGDVTRVELARRSPGPFHRLGRDSDDALWDGLGLEFTGLNKARFLAIAGLRGPAESPAEYAPVLRAARTRDLELICANPDLAVPAGAGMRWCAGAVARDYALLGGRVLMSGKPHTPIYERARAELDRIAHRSVPKGRVLAIGDGIATDIVGANRVGLDCLFVATGVNGQALLHGGQLDEAAAAAALTAGGARATYAIERLI